MSRTDLATLLQALSGDRRAAARHARTTVHHAASIEDETSQMVVAASLHHWYSAVESLLVRVLRAFGQSMPAGDRWHQDVLEAAALDVPGLRPQLIGDPTARHLRKLLAFRHFFRHAYAVDWEPAELLGNVKTLREALPLLDADLDRFEAVLRDALAAP